MDSALESSAAVSAVRRSGAGLEVSLFRLYTLRFAYLILAVGLGIFIWPSVMQHTNEFAARAGVRMAMLAGLGATAVLGLKYPVKMLPLLLFELLWKAIYLVAFAVPLWAAHQIDAAVASDLQGILMVVIFLPLIPWRYVWANYVLARGDRWAG